MFTASSRVILLCPPIYECIPETRSAHRKSDEPGDPGRRVQPLFHFLVVLAAAQNDAADFFAAVTASGGDNSLAILSTVEPLDLPDIRLNAGVLQLLDGRAHQPGPKVQIICFPVPIKPGQLFFLWWHQQLEHEPAEALVLKLESPRNELKFRKAER